MVFRQRLQGHVEGRSSTKGREPAHQALLDEVWPDGDKSNLYNLNSGKRRQSRFPYSRQRSRNDPNTVTGTSPRESLTITM